jgi:hypothetical protein
MGARCKHLIYCYVKKLKVSRDSPLLRKTALTEAEWDALFQQSLAVGVAIHTEADDLVDADEKTRRAYELLQEGKDARAIEAALEEASSAAAAASTQDNPKEPIVERTQTGRLRAPLEVDSECPICCCEMEPDEATTWCRAQCGGNLHAQCFDTWRTHMGVSDVTCPYCRSPWWEPRAAAAASASHPDKSHTRLVITRDDAYQNLAWKEGSRRK